MSLCGRETSDEPGLLRRVVETLSVAIHVEQHRVESRAEIHMKALIIVHESVSLRTTHLSLSANGSSVSNCEFEGHSRSWMLFTAGRQQGFWCSLFRSKVHTYFNAYPARSPSLSLRDVPPRLLFDLREASILDAHLDVETLPHRPYLRLGGFLPDMYENGTDCNWGMRNR